MKLKMGKYYLILIQSTKIKSGDTKCVLRMWSNRNFHTLPMEIKIGIVTLDSNLRFP